MNLKQLSHMLALSQTTVSRALNGYPEVNEETRRRVVDAAKRHGYRPNPSARRLATGKTGMIGYVLPTGTSVDIDPHFVEFLSGLGHRRLALINGDDRETFAIHRERGMRRALAASGLALGERHVCSVTMTEENGYRAARRLLEQSEPPTAIACSSLIMSLGVVRAVRDLGLTIPGDLSLVAHDDVFPWLRPENFPVPLSTTRSSI